jgi:hypothetical protein
MERLSPVYKFSRKALDSTGKFSGYASTFGGEPDAYGDVIAAGAFSESLSEHKANETRPALLWAHRIDEPIGVFTELKEDAKGLSVTGKLSLGGERARAAHSLMQDDALALSIGFRTRDADYNQDGVRILKAIDLVEISAVALPANRNARITQVKSIQDIRAYEAELRDALGFSVRDARKLASGGWPALSKGDPSEEIKAACSLIRASAAKFKE